MIILSIATVFFIVHLIYPINTTNTKLTNISAGDLLGFTGGFLAFVGTMFLGIITWKQSQNADNVSKKLLRLEEDKVKPFPAILSDDLLCITNTHNGEYSYKAEEISQSANTAKVFLDKKSPFNKSLFKFIFTIENIGSCPINTLQLNHTNILSSILKIKNYEIDTNFKNIIIREKQTVNLAIEFIKYYNDSEEQENYYKDLKRIVNHSSSSIILIFDYTNIYDDIFNISYKIDLKYNINNVCEFINNSYEIKHDYDGIVKFDKELRIHSVCNQEMPK